MRTMFLVSLAAVVWSSSMSTARAEGPSPSAAAPGVGVSADLQKTLEGGLRARQPKEFAFIAKVIKFIENGKLGESVVRSTYLWARKKPRRKFQYFERGLRYRATQMGIDLG